MRQWPETNCAEHIHGSVATQCGRDRRARTSDLRLPKPAPHLLGYAPKRARPKARGGLLPQSKPPGPEMELVTGVEPASTDLQGRGYTVELDQRGGAAKGRGHQCPVRGSLKRFGPQQRWLRCIAPRGWHRLDSNQRSPVGGCGVTARWNCRYPTVPKSGGATGHSPKARRKPHRRWRRDWDSNPGTLAGRLFSRQVQ